MQNRKIPRSRFLFLGVILFSFFHVAVCFAYDQKPEDIGCLAGSESAHMYWKKESLLSDAKKEYSVFWQCHYVTYYSFDHKVVLSPDDELNAACTEGFLLESKSLGRYADVTDALLMAIQRICINEVNNGRYDEEIVKLKQLEKSGKYPKFDPKLSY